MERYTMGRGLKPGDTIGVVAPSAPSLPESSESCVKFLKQLGYCVILGQSTKKTWGYLAGTDSLRARDINTFFADPAVDAILCLRGGYGATRLLDLLDYKTIKANPKLFIGYSDITALHIVLRQRCGLATIHAPMAMSFSRKPTLYTVQQFTRGLVQPILSGPFTMPRGHQLTPMFAGIAEGTLTGGNLSLISSLAGTPYELDGTASLLFLEEVGEEAYALDRMLRQLEQSGLIERINGIIWGEFAKCHPVRPQAGEFTIDEVLAYYTRRWKKPSIKGLPAGHGRQNGWLPLGVPAVISATKDGLADFILK